MHTIHWSSETLDQAMPQGSAIGGEGYRTNKRTTFYNSQLTTFLRLVYTHFDVHQAPLRDITEEPPTL